MPSGRLREVESLWIRLVFGFGTVVLLLVIAGLTAGSYYVDHQVAAEEERLTSTLGYVLADAVQRVSFSGRYRAELLAEEFVEAREDVVYLRIEKGDEIFVEAGVLPEPVPSAAAIGSRPRQLDAQGVRVFEVTSAFSDDRSREVVGVVRVGISRQRAREDRRAGLLAVLAFSILTAVLAMFLIVGVSRRFAEPVQALATEFSGILAHTPLAVWIEDRQGGIVRASAEFEARFAAGRHAVGQRFLDLVDEDEAEPLLADDKLLRAGSMAAPRREHELTLDGERRRFLCSRFGLSPSPGQPIEFLCTVALDVTEQRALQETLIQSRRMESIGQFAGGVAHDFNNILTGMSAVTDLIALGDGATDELQRQCQELRSLNDRAAQLTARLLSFGRKQITVVSPDDLNRLLRDLQSFLDRILREDVQIELKLGPPDVLAVEVDRGQIDQVVMNLVSNARDAMPSGGVVVIETNRLELVGETVIGKELLSPGSYARLRVTDAGTGIPPEIADSLFDPFATTKGLGQGTGLGLSIVYSIVTRHGGSVAFHSTSEGATFVVYLPLISEERLEAQPVSTPPSLSIDRPLRILVVDDNAFVRASVVAALRRMGHEIWEAEDGLQGVDRFNEAPERYDVVLLDVVMPGLDGAEVCTAISQTRPDVRVLFMTGYDDDILRDMAYDPKRVAWIGKPFTVEQLLTKIRELLS